MFGSTVDTIRMMQLTRMIPSVNVVAIGYPERATLAESGITRIRDLTPTP